MKKIVGILAAAVVIASSAFAADVSAAVQGYGDLFNVDLSNTKQINVLGWNDPWDREFNWYSTGIGFAYNGDKAGLSFELDNRDVTVKSSKFWIQPIDMLKIQLGSSEITLGKETIDYSGTVFVTDFEGWTFTLTPIAGLTAELGLVTAQPGGWSCNYWYGTKNYYYNEAAPMGEIATTVAYGADFGTIKAAYDYNNKTNIIGLDYAGTFGSVNVSPAVAFTISDATKKLAADVFVTTAVSSVGIAAYTKVDYDLNADANALAILAKAKFTYGKWFLYLNDANVMADSFALEVKPGIDFNCGSAGMEVALDVNIKGSATTINVPFMYNIHF